MFLNKFIVALSVIMMISAGCSTPKYYEENYKENPLRHPFQKNIKNQSFFPGAISRCNMGSWEYGERCRLTSSEGVGISGYSHKGKNFF